jgi:hypothetical protein
LPHVRADLTSLRKEIDACHPFFGRQAGFPREIVKMCSEAFEDVLHTSVWVVGVDEIDILGDVVSVQVLQWRDLDLRRIHIVNERARTAR